MRQCSFPAYAYYTMMPAVLAVRGPAGRTIDLRSIQIVEKLLGCIEGPQPFDCNPQAAACTSPEEQLKAASYIHFRPQKSGFWPPLEVENPFLQEMDGSNESGISIPLSFEGRRKYFFDGLN
ncbi:MAG: hypothetical protein IK099_10425 [Clostridia bacterium]|nr:hypothetical protein [Clostridia bacterium]